MGSTPPPFGKSLHFDFFFFGPFPNEHNTKNTRSDSDNQPDTLNTRVKDLKDTVKTKEYLFSETNIEYRKLKGKV